MDVLKIHARIEGEKIISPYVRRYLSLRLKIAVSSFIATCYAGPYDINAEMVRRGWALAYRRYSKDYVDEEEDARNLKAGMWQGAFVKPWEWRRKEERGKGIMKEVVFGFGGVALGFILSFSGEAIRNRWRTKQERKSLAAVLMVELFSQGAWCVRQGNAWNFYEGSGGAIELRTLRKGRPPSPIIFEKTADKIGIFEAATASKVIAFYGAVEVVRARIDSLSQEREGTAISGRDIKDIAKKWKNTCFQALLAIRAIEKIAEIPPLPNDEKDMSTLKNDLKTIADGSVLVESSNAEQEYG